MNREVNNSNSVTTRVSVNVCRSVLLESHQEEGMMTHSEHSEFLRGSVCVVLAGLQVVFHKVRLGWCCGRSPGRRNVECSKCFCSQRKSFKLMQAWIWITVGERLVGATGLQTRYHTSMMEKSVHFNNIFTNFLFVLFTMPWSWECFSVLIALVQSKGINKVPSFRCPSAANQGLLGQTWKSPVREAWGQMRYDVWQLAGGVQTNAFV